MVREVCERCTACERENMYSWEEDDKEIFRCKECGFEWSDKGTLEIGE